MSAAGWLVMLGGMSWAGSRTINSSGSPLQWRTNYVPYKINPNGKHGLQPADVEAALIASAEEWNLDGAWVELVYEGSSKLKQASSDDGEQVIYFEEDWPETLSPDLLALTYVWSFSDGAIMHFDIAINNDDHRWDLSGGDEHNDLQNALTHEFGHAVGLDHSDDSEATMFAQTSAGELSKRDLAADDVETFSSVYGGTYPFDDMPMMACSATAGSGQVPGGLGALLAGATLLGLRRRQRDGYASHSGSIRGLKVAALAGLLALAPMSASATTYAEVMDLDTLSARAATVVTGQVVAAESSAAPPGIITEVTIRVDETLRGTPAPEHTLTLPGGQLGGDSLYIPGAPQLIPGQRVVLFLDDAGKLVGFSQGAFVLDGQHALRPALRHHEDVAEALTLDEIRSAVR